MNEYFREFDHIDLGATLYTPSINKNITSIAEGEKFPHIKSVVFCLEDAIKESDIQDAMTNIGTFLSAYKKADIKTFIRPRTIENLKELLSLKGIEKIDGFALAKFSTKNMTEYFELLNRSKQKYHIMPVIESHDIFDDDKLKLMRDFLLTQDKQHIVTLRIGGEDMFKALSIKRSCEDLIHDFHIASKIFGDLLAIFKPCGFNISAPVYNCLEHFEVFEKEVQRDIKEGFFGKTIIHPDQGCITNEYYKVTTEEEGEAKEILDSSKEAVFRFKDKMCEPEAHRVWAKTILKRAKIYGITVREL